MRRFLLLLRYLLSLGLALLLAGCVLADKSHPSGQDALSRQAATAAATATALPTIGAKPGPPSATITPMLVSTPTVATLPPSAEWQEIVLPPPKGSEQIIPAGVTVPVVAMSIPEQWGYVNHPGSYLVGEGSPPLPMVVLGPGQPFADGAGSIPQNMDEFADALVQMYMRNYGENARAERVTVGEREGVMLFPAQGEVCADLFIPLGGRYDVVYRFTLMQPLCSAPGQIGATGQAILDSVRFEEQGGP